MGGILDLEVCKYFLENVSESTKYFLGATSVRVDISTGKQCIKSIVPIRDVAVSAANALLVLNCRISLKFSEVAN